MLGRGERVFIIALNNSQNSPGLQQIRESQGESINRLQKLGASNRHYWNNVYIYSKMPEERKLKALAMTSIIRSVVAPGR